MNGAPRRVVVFGSTGLVGGHLTRLLASEADVGRLVAPVRRPPSSERAAGNPKVDVPVVDFANLGTHADRLSADQVFICLGTTMKKAGSREAFRRVDFEAVVNAARVTLDGGARDVFLVSSVGADPAARGFYLRVKGEAEAALAALPFRSVHIARPSVLTGARTESRRAERAGIVFMKLLAPLMVGPTRRYRPIAAEDVARALVVLSRAPARAVHVHESDELTRLGAPRGGSRS